MLFYLKYEDNKSIFLNKNHSAYFIYRNKLVKYFWFVKSYNIKIIYPRVKKCQIFVIYDIVYLNAFVKS